MQFEAEFDVGILEVGLWRIRGLVDLFQPTALTHFAHSFLEGSQVDPGAHGDGVEVISVGEGLGFGFAHFGKFILAGSWELVEVEPLSSISDDAFLEHYVLFAFEGLAFGIGFEAHLWSDEGVFKLSVLLVFF